MSAALKLVERKPEPTARCNNILLAWYCAFRPKMRVWDRGRPLAFSDHLETFPTCEGRVGRFASRSRGGQGCHQE